MAKIGRHSLYDREKAEAVLDRLETGESLASICKDPEMPYRSTFRDWVKADHDGLSARYARAREYGLDAIADHVITLADEQIITERGDDNVARSKLMVDTRKWVLSKLVPKVYGDKVQQEITGADGAPLPVMVYLPSNEREKQTTDEDN